MSFFSTTLTDFNHSDRDLIIIFAFRQWRKLRKWHALSLKKKAKIIMRDWFLSFYCSLVCRPYFDKKGILFLEIKPRERTTSNLKMVTTVILWPDETVKNRRLFCLNFVTKNIHSSTRFIMILKDRYFEIKFQDFACSWSISWAPTTRSR